MKRYSDVVSSYNEYVKIQTVDALSFESSVPEWVRGQERYLSAFFKDIDKDKKILDIACGDGVGLRYFKHMGFKDVVGVDLSKEKVDKASSYGYEVHLCDMHDLSIFQDCTFDIVYSSHTIEHAYYPAKAVGELCRVLRGGGTMFVVLPYPEDHVLFNEAHGGKFELGTCEKDDGESVVQFFKNFGLSLVGKKFDEYRQPEIWLIFTKEEKQ